MMRGAGRCALLVACAGGVANAQSLDRSKQPVAPPAAPFKFPKTQTKTLANGLRVIVVENHALPLVTVRAVLDADSLSDPAGKEGLFALTNAMLREGTKTMSADEQSSATAALGNAVTPIRFTTITESLDGSLAMMADMLENPSFPQAAFDRRKAALISLEQRRAEAPASATNQTFLKRLLGDDDPTARSFLPSEASIASITRDDVVAFYGANFRPAAATIVVVGDVQPASAFAEVQKRFSSWTGSAAPARPAPVAIVSRPTTIYLLDQPGAKQTQIAVGTTGPRRDSRDAAALDVMTYVLGAGSASRISQNLRERHSYVYSGLALGMQWRPLPNVSLISGLLPVNPAKSDSALIEWLSEIRSMPTRPPTPVEMATAKGLLVGALPGQVETIDRIADRVSYLVHYELPLDYYDGYARAAMAVKPSDVTAAAKKYLDPSYLVIVVSGDRKMLEPLLRAANLGAIVVE
jgi:zinc protease